jgi:hypothetical protein
MQNDLRKWLRLVEIAIPDAKQLIKSGKQQAAIAWLLQNGFRQVNYGEFASVWTDDEQAVVRVFKADPCYVRFVTFCRAHRGNKHLPRISRVYALEQDGGIVFMEMLSPCLDSKLAQNIEEYFKYRLIELTDPRWHEWDASELPDWSAFTTAQPDLADTIGQLAKAFSDNTCKPDLHQNNLMMRGDTIVIIDPVRP